MSIYEQGKQAFKNSKPLSDNPCEFQSNDWYAWYTGWTTEERYSEMGELA